MPPPFDRIPADTVFLDSLQLTVTLGADHWSRPARPHPVLVSVYLHLRPSYLSLAGSSDDVEDSIHYGHLSKAILGLSGRTFDGARGLARAVRNEAVGLADRKALEEVRVKVSVPKAILLADDFVLEVRSTWEEEDGIVDRQVKVSVKNITIPVIIGVNPPERESKQRVIVNIDFYENNPSKGDPHFDYPEFISTITKIFEGSSYLTLEAFVLQAVQIGCFVSEKIHAVTVRAQKPSAISFARSSGVEITRTRTSILKST